MTWWRARIVWRNHRRGTVARAVERHSTHARDRYFVAVKNGNSCEARRRDATSRSSVTSGSAATTAGGIAATKSSSVDATTSVASRGGGVHQDERDAKERRRREGRDGRARRRRRWLEIWAARLSSHGKGVRRRAPSSLLRRDARAPSLHEQKRRQKTKQKPTPPAKHTHTPQTTANAPQSPPEILPTPPANEHTSQMTTNASQPPPEIPNNIFDRAPRGRARRSRRAARGTRRRSAGPGCRPSSRRPGPRASRRDHTLSLRRREILTHDQGTSRVAPWRY